MRQAGQPLKTLSADAMADISKDLCLLPGRSVAHFASTAAARMWGLLIAIFGLLEREISPWSSGQTSTHRVAATSYTRATSSSPVTMALAHKTNGSLPWAVDFWNLLSSTQLMCLRISFWSERLFLLSSVSGTTLR